MILALCGGGGAFFVTPHAIGLLLGLLIGVLNLVAWPCWSHLVPRWRDWVEDKGLTPGEVQALAVSTGLIWPKGPVFERTEFKRRNGERGQ